MGTPPDIARLIDSVDGDDSSPLARRDIRGDEDLVEAGGHFEGYYYKDKHWRILRDPSGAIVKVYSGERLPPKLMSSKERQTFLELVEGGAKTMLACQLTGVPYHRLVLTRKYYPEWWEEVTVHLGAQGDRCMLTIYKAATEGSNVQAAATYVNLLSSERSEKIRIAHARREVAAREREVAAREREVGSGPGSGVPDLSVLGDDFEEYAHLYEKAVSGEAMDDGEAAEFGRLNAILARSVAPVEDEEDDE